MGFWGFTFYPIIQSICFLIFWYWNSNWFNRQQLRTSLNSQSQMYMNKLVQIAAYLIITEGLTFSCLEHLWYIIPFQTKIIPFTPTKSLISPNQTHFQKAVTCLCPNWIKNEMQKQKIKQNYLSKHHFKSTDMVDVTCLRRKISWVFNEFHRISQVDCLKLSGSSSYLFQKCCRKKWTCYLQAPLYIKSGNLEKWCSVQYS